MDMKQLIAQIDHIENKQILNEDAHYTTAPVNNRPQVSKSNNQTSIYEMLIKEFGYDLNEAPAVPNPYQGADAAKFAAMSPQDQAWLTKGGGVPDINDEFILARAPNKGKAAGGAAQPAAPAQVPAGINPETGEKYDDGTNAPLQEPPGAEKPAGGGDTGEVPGVTTQSGATPTVPAGINPETGEKYDDGTNAPLQEPPGAEKPAGGAAQPAAPAAPAANKSMTPAITAYAASMGLLKGGKPDVAAIKKFQQDNGLKADGIIGPNTAGAILSAQKPGMAGSGRGGQGGPTAAQLAQAPKPAGGGAQPATGSVKPRYKTPQEFDKEIARFSKTSNPNLPPNARYIATLQAEKAALSGGAAQPARPALPGKAVPGGGQISDTPAAESMLQRIKSLAGL